MHRDERVTDEMISVALIAFQSGDMDWSSQDEELMRFALEEAIDAMPKQKPVSHLVWRQYLRAADDVEDYYEVARPGDKCVDGSEPFPVYAHPVSALVNAQADADVVERWQPIETAPKDGTEILLHREDCGVMLGRWIAPCEFLNEDEYVSMDPDSWEEPDWFGADFVAGHRITNDGAPTEWQPIPTPPALRSSGSAEVGSATSSKGTGGGEQ